MIDKIKITPLHEIGTNERGTTYSFHNSRTGDLMYGFRKKGSVNGNHFHKGASPQKNPEIFILLVGEALLTVQDLENGQEASELISAPCRVEIFPNIWHVVEAKTDIYFLELNTLEQHAADTYYEK